MDIFIYLHHETFSYVILEYYVEDVSVTKGIAQIETFFFPFSFCWNKFGRLCILYDCGYRL